jgi:hypothetical protein
VRTHEADGVVDAGVPGALGKGTVGHGGLPLRENGSRFRTVPERRG